MPEGAGREAKRRRALTMPLCPFEAECDIRPGREIHSVRDLKALPAAVGLHSHPVKSFVACFIADFLDILLRQSQPDIHMSAFLFDAINNLAELRDPAAIANFHIVFLYRLTHFVGIGPDISEAAPGCVFDMKDGRFRTSVPVHGHYIPSSEAQAMKTLARSTFRNMHRVRWTRSERNTITDYLTDYYCLHFSLTGPPRSLDILRSLF